MITKHSPAPWSVIGNTIVSTFGNRVVAEVNGPNQADLVEEKEANKVLLAAAPDLLAELEQTARLAYELMERANTLDRRLCEYTDSAQECELGEVVRLRQQLSRNRTAIEKATAKANTPPV